MSIKDFKKHHQEHEILLKSDSDNNNLVFVIPGGFLFGRKRQLIISPDFIQIGKYFSKGSESQQTQLDSVMLSAKAGMRFSKEEIFELRNGVNWIRGFRFTVGIEYQFFLRARNKRIIKIGFRSLYGMRKAELHKLYFDIYNALWQSYFVHVAEEFIKKFCNGERIEINGIQISHEGVFLKRNKFIPWENVKIAEYYSYINIYSSDKPSTINRSFSYLMDWNTLVLSSVIQTILANRNNWKLIADIPNK